MLSLSLYGTSVDPDEMLIEPHCDASCYSALITAATNDKMLTCDGVLKFILMAKVSNIMTQIVCSRIYS